MDVTGANGVTWLRRFLPDGSPDKSFGIDGLAIVRPPGYDPSKAIAEDAALDPVLPDTIRVLPNGQLVVAGLITAWLRPYYEEYRPGSFRLNPDGALDTTYGINGLASSAEMYAADTFVDAGGSAVFVGRTRSEKAYRSAIFRFAPNGNPDVDFGDGGLAVRRTPRPSKFVSAVAIRPTSYLVWGWRVGKPYGKHNEVARWDLTRVSR